MIEKRSVACCRRDSPDFMLISGTSYQQGDRLTPLYTQKLHLLTPLVIKHIMSHTYNECSGDIENALVSISHRCFYWLLLLRIIDSISILFLFLGLFLLKQDEQEKATSCQCLPEPPRWPLWFFLTYNWGRAKESSHLLAPSVQAALCQQPGSWGRTQSSRWWRPWEGRGDTARRGGTERGRWRGKRT